jgi:hypothetical protein
VRQLQRCKNWVSWALTAIDENDRFVRLCFNNPVTFAAVLCCLDVG